MNRSPGGPAGPKPSLRPPRVGNIAGVTGDALVMGGAVPILLWFVAACRPWAWSARRSGALVGARPSAATPAGAGSGGRWGVGRAGPAAFPHPRRGPLLGRGPLGSGGAENLRSCGPQAGRGTGGGGGAGAALPLLAPLPRRMSGCHPLSPARPPGVYSCCGGRRAAVGVERGPVCCQRVSAAGGGGREGASDPPALVRAPAFPRPASVWAALFALSWAPLFRGRSGAGNAEACGRFTGGAWRAAAPAVAAVPPPLGAAASPWGFEAAVSPVGLSLLLGWRGGGRGGGPLAP